MLHSDVDAFNTAEWNTQLSTFSFSLVFTFTAFIRNDNYSILSDLGLRVMLRNPGVKLEDIKDMRT